MEITLILFAHVIQIEGTTSILEDRNRIQSDFYIQGKFSGKKKM